MGSVTIAPCDVYLRFKVPAVPVDINAFSTSDELCVQ